MRIDAVERAPRSANMNVRVVIVQRQKERERWEGAIAFRRGFVGISSGRTTTVERELAILPKVGPAAFPTSSQSRCFARLS